MVWSVKFSIILKDISYLMGNKDLRSAMIEVQRRSFDTSSLREWEDMLWREFPLDVFKGFDSVLKVNSDEIGKIFEFSSRIEEEEMQSER